MIRFFSLAIALCLSTLTFAQSNIKTMFYNLLKFPSAPPGSRAEILKNILNEHEPDIFMICELESEAGADLILNTSLNDEGADFSRAPFVYNQSGSNELQQLLFYRSGMFTLETSEIIFTSTRDINKYVLKLNTTDQDTDPVYIDVYVSHLKSSQGTSNQQLRLEMVTQFTEHLTTIDPNSFVIFAGDFNLYSSSEPAYQELLDNTNAIVMVDPIDTPGSWHNNDSYQDIHTQSTRISSAPFGGAGAGGGLDDRFDFITISENMLSDPKLRYVNSTYKALGNNGNCFNNDISSEDCTGEFNQTLRNNLYSMSDHLPVVLDLETNKEIVILENPNFVSEGNFITLKKTFVKNQLEIVVNPSNLQINNIIIYNSLGQKVKTAPINNQKNIILDVAFLSNGLYYLKTNSSQQQPIKFIKAN